MENQIGNAYLSSAIDELVNTLGIKEQVEYQDLVPLLRKDIKLCVKKIASVLGLPIDINVQYISARYDKDNSVKFQTSDLARTDSAGRGRESITAQVTIPTNLPMFGTSSLVDFPIHVRVSENCSYWSQAFMAVMAHELSHILLYSLCHPQKNNEIYTDLTAMILGFGSIMENGRKQTEYAASGNATTTTTYGYLNDAQFAFASGRVKDILNQRKRHKDRLLTLIVEVKKQRSSCRKGLCLFKEFLEHLDKNQNRKIKKQDIQKIVNFHSPGYTAAWELILSDSRRCLQEADVFVGGIFHYTEATVETLQKLAKKLEPFDDGFRHGLPRLNADLKVLKKNVGLIVRIKTALRNKQKGKK
ncbi:MAG: hypothetical protein PHH75_00905 [Candidatus Omnitrophica bacterium]|nr:hypothetical protein [Candidatus Omnitrophota bacterium]MDD5573718.1 hypothetical protein [Candidatus Omnitrophota bacterium]